MGMNNENHEHFSCLLWMKLNISIRDKWKINDQIYIKKEFIASICE